MTEYYNSLTGQYEHIPADVSKQQINGKPIHEIMIARAVRIALRRPHNTATLLSRQDIAEAVRKSTNG